VVERPTNIEIHTIGNSMKVMAFEKMTVNFIRFQFQNEIDLQITDNHSFNPLR
jgi:hypothetical protein